MTPIPLKTIYVARTDVPTYGLCNQPVPPEVPPDTRVTQALLLLRRLLRDAGLDSARYGSAEWNPLGDLIQEGAHVLVKPNWVVHQDNSNAASRDCLVTHPSVITAVL